MKTPFLRYRVDVLATNCQIAAAQLGSVRRDWMPELASRIPQEVLAIFREFAKGASCRTIDDAEALHNAGFKRVLISRPIVHAEALDQLSQLARTCELICVADHFRHAELLSNALRVRHASAELLIEVQAGPERTGVRPGPDSTRLATAAAQLPGLRVAGVYIDDSLYNPVGLKTSDTVVESTAMSDIRTVAAHCRRMIETSGIACPELVTGRRQLSSIFEPDGITISLFNPLDAWTSQVNGDSSNPTPCATATEAEQPAASVISRVVSRPTLETCVIDFDSPSWGLTAPTIVSPKGASFIRRCEDTCTLQLSGSSLDLRIGDTVEVKCDWRSCLSLPTELIVPT